jgi:hypothetical protein
MGMLRRSLADHDDLGVVAERPAEAEPEVHRHADHKRDVGALERCAAHAREEGRVVGGHAAARKPVQQHGNLELRAERLERLLAVRPVQAGARHDRRALGPAKQLDRLLDAFGGRERTRVG